MKKLVLSLIAIIAALPLFADSEVTVTSGDPKFIMEDDGTAIVVIDYSNAIVEGDKVMSDYIASRGDDYAADWPEVETKVLKYFVQMFNYKKKNGIKATTEDDAAKYKMAITLSEIDMGNTAASIAPTMSFKMKQGGAIISGKVVITDCSTGDSVCEIDFNNVAGVGNTSETVRIREAFHTLGNKIKKLAKE